MKFQMLDQDEQNVDDENVEMVEIVVEAVGDFVVAAVVEGAAVVGDVDDFVDAVADVVVEAVEMPVVKKLPVNYVSERHIHCFHFAWISDDVCQL